MRIRPIVRSDYRNGSRTHDTSASKGRSIRAKLNMAMMLGSPRQKAIRGIQELSMLYLSSERGKALGLEKREALEKAMLISFVNKQVPGTARAIEMHLPFSFCNVTSSTVSRDRMSRKKAINCSLLARIRVKA